MKRRKINKLLDKPVTWGSVIKVNGIITLIYFILYGLFMIHLWWDEICDLIDDFRNRGFHPDKKDEENE